MLCEVCSRMFSSGNMHDDHHTTLESITKAAADGCYVCAPLLKNARKRITDFEVHFVTGGKCSYRWYNAPVSDNIKPFDFEIWWRQNDVFVYPWRFHLIPQVVLPVRPNVYGRKSAIPVNDCLREKVCHPCERLSSGCTEVDELLPKQTRTMSKTYSTANISYPAS
jgi:hypothetical protein